MPPNDRVRLDDDKDPCPAQPEMAQYDPEGAIGEVTREGRESRAAGAGRGSRAGPRAENAGKRRARDERQEEATSSCGGWARGR
jgi:hypothetical protein